MALISALDEVQDFVVELTTDLWPGSDHSRADVEIEEDAVIVGYRGEQAWIKHTRVIL